MLIRIMPDQPHPNILFTLNMQDPMHDSEKKPCPSNWCVQAQMVEALQDEGLGIESPSDIHAFDKAAWHTALMTEVAFDLVERSVTCTFFDGSVVSWSMSSIGAGSRCLAELDDVVAAVQGSAQESERERHRNAGLHVQTSSHQAGQESGASSVPASPVTSSPLKAHKRQKSLFSSIVAAFKGALSDNANRGQTLPTSLPPLKIPSNSSSHSRSSSTFSRTQRSPPDSPTVAERPPPPIFQLRVRPRAPIPPPPHCKYRSTSERLRYHARSSLVDILRRYVYPVFSTTCSPSFARVQTAPDWIAQVYGYPPGSYPAWAARSLLRKTDERMREMIAEANAHGFGHALGSDHSQSQAASPLPEDEDDAISAGTSASASTETDGSSVHTPTDSPLRSPFSPGVVSSGGGAPRLSSLETKMLPQVPRSPSPPSPTFDFDMSTYHALGMMRTRLLTYLTRMGSSPRQINSNSHYGSDLTILEIRSRRRAWSSRDYVGGARLSLIGLATPFRSSPLARCEPVTAEALAHMQAQAARESQRAVLAANRSFVGLPDLGAEFGVSVGVKTVTKEMDARLFPLCEEDEEDEPSGYGLDEYVEDEAWRDMREFDLESGLLVFPRPELPPPAADAKPPSYSHIHPMTRTRTQSMRKEHPRLPPMTLVQQRGGLGRGEGTLTADSLLCQPLNVKVPVPVMLDSSDSFEDCEERGAEFTLAMDLPVPPRGGWRGGDVSRR